MNRGVATADGGMLSRHEERRMPVRIQRRRTKGWRMPENAVYVGRPTKWGNPFVVGRDNPMIPGRKVEDRRHAVRLYQGSASLQPRLVVAAQAELRGKDLVCWCPPNPPYERLCHADVLLEIANA